MSPSRLRPAGFDACPGRPSSLRAQARESFRAEAERDEVLKRPLPDPPPQAGEGTGPLRGEATTNITPLTQKVRALYEDSVVPVREIARLAGVTERTLYKYVEKGGWRRRHACAARDAAVAAANRGRRRTPARGFAPVKGVGGRFIAREDADKPVPRGLKALDPEGAARAVAACERAEELSDEAVARVRRLREVLSDARILAMLVPMLRDLVAIEDAKKAAEAAPPKRDVEELRRKLAQRLEAWVLSQEDADAR